MKRTIAWAACAAVLAGCVGQIGGQDEGDEVIDAEADALTAGVNGGACLHSPYNCKLRANGGARVTHQNGHDGWYVEQAVVVDGDGAPLATEPTAHLVFNFGQKRIFGGKPYGFALTTGNGSAGWFPIDRIVAASSFESRVGSVHAHDPHHGHLGCYQIKNGSDPALEMKKVVYDSSATHERAGDYLPLVRGNGKRSANLAFNVPGAGLGGTAIDHFPAGTKFRRVVVPTDSGHPSLDVKLWVKDGHGRYRKHDGDLKFVYGFVHTATGENRFGWMAYPALEPASGCP